MVEGPHFIHNGLVDSGGGGATQQKRSSTGKVAELKSGRIDDRRVAVANIQNPRILSNPYNLKILKIRLNTKTNMFSDGIADGKELLCDEAIMITTVGCCLSSNQVKSRPASAESQVS